MGAIYSSVEMRHVFFLCMPHFMKIYSACGTIRGNSIICFCVVRLSYYNQSGLNLGLPFALHKLFESYYTSVFFI